jgi:hypothetical protein
MITKKRFTNTNKDYYKNIIKYLHVIQRLQELEDKLENGQLIEFEYKCGDIVWSINYEDDQTQISTKIIQCKIIGKYYNSIDGIYYIAELIDSDCYHQIRLYPNDILKNKKAAKNYLKQFIEKENEQ